ncbi:unnamed protein product [Acanthoscelides obtectus]|uniref:Tc1-like transposase DDE domain-containing protein n=1 Tax=Acanthoscelides obtectus TaxID=200917 RepID=A0A9P0KW03_ACAOB|nr:unnamed protein product [Acanthoscelides obtectus]CAK1627790.1 Histone-lysine N-methyltransferase SETMAR [Acanthoscelides obtectus]
MELNQENFRAIIYYNFQRELSQQKCLAELLSVFGNEAPPLSDDPRVGAPKTAVTQENPTKVIRSRSVSKKLVAIFVSKAGHEQRTVTEDWYTTICLTKIITELRKINPERRIIFHQDNASSHTAQKTRQYLTEENEELLDHPPYSPDLSPNDFFTFPKIKNRLRGQRFQSPKEAVDAFKNAVLDLPENEWNKCFENWFERMQMYTT